ncbi:amino acid ABC transporter permease [Mesorhizobium sp. Root157]|uniref:ABC transporter permease n=1 Tax=Mesorhizobium sp. Root157 TaxID=1736477 RepID=UPI0006F62EAD|nr:ABC transporter permease [Mesorhizobium sp. Root157]KQZ98467.1 amino acid ABC transporter permease [Mesorhizobium sp. Root157]
MSASTQTADSVERPPLPPHGWSRQRVLGTALVALWALLGVGLVAYLVSAWNTEMFQKYAPGYVSGVGITISLVAISIVAGAILSVPVAYGRMSRNPVVASLAYAYVYFFRGTPLLAQAFLVYYGFGSFRPQLDAIGLWSFFREAFNCAIFAFSLNTAAYQAEILRGAIQAVPKGQWEGAASLGLHKIQTLRKIILPQALIVALRPYGNEVILMIKGSAIVAIITVYDLMGITRLTYSRTFDFQSYLWAAIIYLLIVETLRHGIDWIERRITRHLKR